MTHARPEPDDGDLFPLDPPLPAIPPSTTAAHRPLHVAPEPERGRPDPTTTPILALDRLTISYARPAQPPLTIVTDLTLHLHPGEFVCVAGRSGSGKTSILRVAAGLAAPSGGTVGWDGIDIAALTSDALATRRRHLCGILDQSAALLPELSALENVLLAAVPDRRVKQLRPHAEALLDQLGLATRVRHRPDSLSGGERQRVGLARAMLLDPPVLIVDEPTASLDRTWADAIIDTLATAAQHGTAVLAASHDPHLTTAAHVAVTLD